MGAARKFAFREDPGLAVELARRLDLVEDDVPLAGARLRILRPRNAEALLDEESFEHEEFLPYWAELWPSGLALARAVERLSLSGRRVLELGCGLGLPSLAAAFGGAEVLATDWSSDAVTLLAANAARNGVQVRGLRVAWDEPSALVEGAPWDLVLAADVLYERRNVDALLRLLPRLVRPAGCVLLADPGRPAAPGLFAGLAQTGWRVDGGPARPGGEPAVSLLRPRTG